MESFYIFYVNIENYIVYERTCGCEKAAKRRVKDLKEYYSDAFYLTSIPNNFNFMY